ncbi:hypothetical protein Tco_1018382 [Tanacetum coccineum]|uniref:Reverse transcriptase domain-containing protein n=1 Tax=Tanacetum coccineum TaxID=301880 RepID=A0ABQ5FU69_9ASTR
MVEKPVLNNKERVTGQREIRPVWNNAQRVNHQNKFTHPHPKRNFVPTAVVTKSGQVPVNTAKQSSPRAVASIIRRAFNQKSAAKIYNLNEKVKTARVNNVTTVGPKAVVSAAVGYRENASIDETPPSYAITSDLPITDSFVMEDEHLDTILEMDSDEEIESGVENLNLTPSESEDLSDYVSEYDLPFCDNSPDFNNDSEIFSNPLFDSNADYTSSDDESSSEEDVPVENFKIYSNTLFEFDEEIFSSEINLLYNKVLEDLDSIPPGNENDHFNAEFDLIESLLNKDTVITSPKIDFLLEEFDSELALINPIPSGIAETNFDPKKDIRLIKKFYMIIHLLDLRKSLILKMILKKENTYENSLIYKEKTKKIHDSKIKNRVFNVGDRVLLFNSRLKIFSGKLKTRWTGPFTVTQVFPYGTVELSSTNGPNFKVNGHRLKHYFGGDIPPMVVPDLQTFPMDN